MILMGILLMTYDAANGAHLYTYTNISTVADTIHLQCHRGLKIRSRLELAKSCSSEVACHAIRTKERTTSIWCACPQKITWPRSWNYILSTVRLRNLMEHLPGMSIGEVVVRWGYGMFPSPGPRLNIKTVLSTYGDFHVKDKTAVRTSYL